MKYHLYCHFFCHALYPLVLFITQVATHIKDMWEDNYACDGVISNHEQSTSDQVIHCRHGHPDRSVLSDLNGQEDTPTSEISSSSKASLLL